MAARDPLRRPYPIVGTPWWAVDLPGGHVAIFDADAVRHFAGRSARYHLPPRNRYGYVTLTDHGPHETRRTHYLHRLVMDAGAGEMIDHENRDGLDCRRENLRPADHVGNGANRARQIRSGSGFKGVYRGSKNSWRARIGLPMLGLGSFPSPEEAARAYDRAALERWGAFARLNFPEAA